jgi:hypothetical protein
VTFCEAGDADRAVPKVDFTDRGADVAPGPRHELIEEQQSCTSR